jgi:hypothetical protein|tara:strand:+ start:2543 stop:2737 length:195 start_codon:yes stop_codon:yes gene_type:complete
MKNSKSCGLLEIMTDVVTYWAYDLELNDKISDKDVKDLSKRLKKAHRELEENFSCIKNKVPLLD